MGSCNSPETQLYRGSRLVGPAQQYGAGKGEQECGKPELKYRGELSGSHSSNTSQEQKLPRRSQDKEN